MRDLAGKVNANGTVTLYAITSTADNGTGDTGADPNELVSITDQIANPTAPGAPELFTVDESAVSGEVLRGVAVDSVSVPEPLSAAEGLGALIMFVGFTWRHRKP